MKQATHRVIPGKGILCPSAFVCLYLNFFMLQLLVIPQKVVPLWPSIRIHNVMMQLVSSNGTVLLEREKSCATRSKNSSLHVRRMSKGMKKTVTPQLMSREEFFTKVIKSTDDANV